MREIGTADLPPARDVFNPETTIREIVNADAIVQTDFHDFQQQSQMTQTLNAHSSEVSIQSPVGQMSLVSPP